MDLFVVPMLKRIIRQKAPAFHPLMEIIPPAGNRYRIRASRYMVQVGMSAFHPGRTWACATPRPKSASKPRSSEADKYSPITQLPNQFAVYGTCTANHGQRFG